MESFVIDPQNFKKTKKRRIIAIEGVVELAGAGLLPFLSNQDIQDRSKADLFAKMIVLFQIIWFGLQVISRLAAGLSVTPLEAHTAVHVCCTIVVYLLWLKKPYNVDTPMILKGSEIEDIVALFNFSEINSLVYQAHYEAYETAREIYFKGRYVRNTNNILDHDPTPEPPTRIGSERLIALYTTLDTSEDSWRYNTTHQATRSSNPLLLRRNAA